MNKRRLTISLVLFFYLILTGTCIFKEATANAGFLPFGRMYKAAKDERAYTVQASDTRLQLQLHKAILQDDPSNILTISTFVYLGHGFLVGEVNSEEQSKNLVNTARKVSGLSGLSYYLPQKINDKKTGTPSTLEMKLKGMLEPDYPSSKLTIKVVQNVVVVLGVLSLDEQTKVLNSLKNFEGVDKVINFLMAPAASEAKRGHPRPLRNLLN